MVLLALILLLFDIVMLFCIAFNMGKFIIMWFGDETLTYCVYVMIGSLPVIWLTFLCEPYPVTVSNSKEIAKDIADAIDDRKEGKNV
jgi:hypothetical protein